MSNADIAVSIVTGKIVGYTTLTLFILAILVFGIYEIKKQVLNKKNIGKEVSRNDKKQMDS